jgi:hypothetical protein
MQPTLEQLERADLDVKTRAWQREQVSNTLGRSRQVVVNLTPQVEAIGKTLRQLGEIQELACALPRDLSGTGGTVCRDQIQKSTIAASRSLAIRRERLQKQLDKALADIPALEAKLEELNS